MRTKNSIITNRLFSATTHSIFALALSFLFVSCGKSDADFDAAGTFETTEVIVSSEASGKILSFDLEEGQILTANQIVGTIDSVQLCLRKLQLQASGRAIQSRRPDIKKQIAALEQQIVTAKTERKRAENLVKANAANQKQLDDINAQIAVLEKQLDAQKTILESSNQGLSDETEGLTFQIKQLEDQLAKCKITSPINGTVLVKYAEIGEVTAAGKALFKMADTENMILRAYITADQLTKVKMGQKVKVMSDFGKDDTKTYTGTMAWISSKAEFTPKTIQTKDERANLVYAIKINVKNDGYLKIGMYGSIQLTTPNL
jgi:HlyD family secretion protein